MSGVQKRIVVLDGGTGMYLVEMGHTFVDTDPLWSAAIVSTHPDDLIKLHKEFFLAGAEVVVTATYQASVEGYKKRFGVTDAEALELIRQGVKLAKTARDEAEQITGRHGYVAASIGPYGATLCDRSEYHGNYADSMSIEDLSSWHLPRLRAVVETSPDLLAMETIPVVKEAKAILNCLKEFPGVKAWVTFQCKNGKETAHGESIQDAVRTVLKYDSVVAVGVNCIHPDYVTSLLQNLAQLELTVPVIVKPNGGLFDHDGRVTTKHRLTDYLPEWLSVGASWIGGCCQINPSDISDLRKTLEKLPDVCLRQKGDPLL